MLKKFLASMGFGAAKVNLQLDQDVVTMGQPITGTILVVGGETKQETEGLSVSLRVSSRYTRGDNVLSVHEKIATISITREKLVLEPGSRLEYPFSFVCPEGLPVSSVNTKYYFETDLDIDNAIDAKDRDHVTVLPSGILKNFLNGFQSLGFIHYAEGYTGQRDSTQIIQFHPTTWLYGQYDEIVFSYATNLTDTQITGWFELDKKTRGSLGALADKLDLDEKKGRYTFYSNDLSSVERAKETIQQFIIKNSEGLYG
ncbi:sporulation protein [Shimazuella kribbensis]|uniref:sporulation protein n=1 Tax=Shimazuella kribbensis TaxID=139808 RepID=UPI00040387C7|nr:sporulation protein [Shimazuella kribbensis]